MTKTVRFNYIHVLQASISPQIQPYSYPEFMMSPRIESYEIQAKILPLIKFHRFALSIEKISWFLTIFIDFDFYLLATPGCNYTLNYTDVIVKGKRVKISWKTVRLQAWPIQIYCLRESSFHYLMNWWTDVVSSRNKPMKETSLSLILPIDR